MENTEKKELWAYNTSCPHCGSTIEDPSKFQAAETGLSYCSGRCAKIHVNENYDENAEQEKHEALKKIHEQKKTLKGFIYDFNKENWVNLELEYDPITGLFVSFQIDEDKYLTLFEMEEKRMTLSNIEYTKWLSKIPGDHDLVFPEKNSPGKNTKKEQKERKKMQNLIQKIEVKIINEMYEDNLLFDVNQLKQLIEEL